MEFFLEKIIRFSRSKAGKIPFAILENILCKVLFFNKNKLYNSLINYFQLFSNGKIFSNFRKKKLNLIKSNNFLERWPSGLRRTLGKCVYCQRYRGFESHSPRHFERLKKTFI